MSQSGFEEIQHTADWALRIWSADLAGLLRQAGLGMNALMGLELDKNQSCPVSITLAAADAESLLVAFLNEILFYQEVEGIGFADYPLSLDGLSLKAELAGFPVHRMEKPVKAVTFHNLVIEPVGEGLEARVVFDV